VGGLGGGEAGGRNGGADRAVSASLLSGGMAGGGCRRFTPMDVRQRICSLMDHLSCVYSVKLSTKPSICCPFFFLVGNLCPDILVETNTC
jgi:hypothetical protein